MRIWRLRLWVFAPIAVMVLGGLHASSVRAQVPTVEQPAGGRQYRVNGTAVDAITGHPVSGARVTLQSVKSPDTQQSMLTDENGHFDFEHVAAGKYSLEGADGRHNPSHYQQHENFWTGIVTGDALDSTNLVLRMVPYAVLAGRATEGSGEGVRQATVTLYIDNHSSGTERVQKLKVTQTDDQGAFEFSHLNPGTYFVSVAATPWYAVHPPAKDIQSNDVTNSDMAALDVAYPVTYYGGATDSDGATPIPVKAADRLVIEIDLHPVPAVHLRIHLPGDQHSGFRFPALQSTIFDGMEIQAGVEEQVVGQDMVELSGIPPGKYTLQMAGAGGEQGQAVNLTAGTSSDLEVQDMPAGAEIAGLVRLPAERGTGALRIMLRSSGSAEGISEQVDEKGGFAFHGVWPGKYEVLPIAGESPLAVADMSVNGASVGGHVLQIADSSPVQVALQLAEGKVTVQGYAQHDGRPAPGVMIVLVPHNPDANRDLFRRDQSDSDGSFELANVVAGAYTVVAIADGWNLDWAQANVLARYLAKGLQVQVPAKGIGTFDLPKPVEAQPCD